MLWSKRGSLYGPSLGFVLDTLDASTFHPSQARAALKARQAERGLLYGSKCTTLSTLSLYHPHLR